MAACELRGELKYRDGETKTLTVKAENNLKSILSSVKKLNSEISELLTSLVEQEKGLRGDGKGGSPRVEVNLGSCEAPSHGDYTSCPRTVPGKGISRDEEEDDSDEEEAKETAVVKSNSGGPPSKRRRASKP